jgi:hypothetical protein
LLRQTTLDALHFHGGASYLEIGGDAFFALRYRNQTTLLGDGKA